MKLSSSPKKESKIIESFHLDEVLRYAGKQTLLIFGIGETLVSSPSLLGSSNWGWDTVSQNLNQGIPIEKTAETILPLWNYLSSKTPLIPMEPSTLDVLRKIEKKGAITIGISSNYLEVAYPVITKLKNIGIDFSSSPACTKDLTLNTPYPAKMLSGILFSGLQNSKGHVILSYLEKIDLKYDQIIFIDNNLEYIQDVEKAAIILEKPFLGIWYKKKPKGFKSLNPNIAKLQSVFVDHVLPNHLADLLLKKQLNEELLSD